MENLSAELSSDYKCQCKLPIMKKPSPILAVARGHVTVTLPVVVVIALCGFIGRLFVGPGGLLIGIIIGALVAWPCWSFLIPRWRDWVEGKGWLRKMSNLLPRAPGCFGRKALSLSARSFDAKEASADGKAPSNKRLERTRHERASLLGCVGEPLKRNVGLLRYRISWYDLIEVNR